MAYQRIEIHRDPEYIYYREFDPEVGFEGTTWDPVPGGREDNRRSIVGKVAAALDANQTYLNRNNPTAAQTTAQVQGLTRQVNGLIRLLVEQLDNTQGT